MFSKIDPAPSGSRTKCPFAGFADAPEPPLGLMAASSHEAATRFPRCGKSWELCGSRPLAPGARLRGDVCTTLLLSWCAVDLDAAMSWATIRAVGGSGPAVTVRASPVLVRADSISIMDITLPSPNRLERHSGFVRALGISKQGLDLLRLTRITCLHALAAM